MVLLVAPRWAGGFGEALEEAHEAGGGGFIMGAEIGNPALPFFVLGVEGLGHLVLEIGGERLLAVGAAAFCAGFVVLVAVAEPVR